jgi:hypothetical protein
VFQIACKEGLISSLALVAVLGLDVDPRDLWVVKEDSHGKNKKQNKQICVFLTCVFELQRCARSSRRGTTTARK